MKKFKLSTATMIAFMIMFLSAPKAHAQFVIAEVVKLTVKKVIKAIDLKVQRMQNKTIWLQNAQKVIENGLSKVKLTKFRAGHTSKNNCIAATISNCGRSSQSSPTISE